MEITSVEIMRLTRKAYGLLESELKTMEKHLKEALCPISPEKELVETIEFNAAEQKNCRRMIDALDFEIGKE